MEKAKMLEQLKEYRKLRNAFGHESKLCRTLDADITRLTQQIDLLSEKPAESF